MRHLLPAAAALLVLSACGEKAPEPVGRQLSQVDTSKAVSDTGRKVDAGTMQTRRIAGTWRGTTSGRSVEATFGSDGTLSLQIMQGDGLVDAATGTWKLSDGTLSGTTGGASGELKRYARWSAGFAGDRAMNMSGSDGAILAVRRK